MNSDLSELHHFETPLIKNLRILVDSPIKLGFFGEQKSFWASFRSSLEEKSWAHQPQSALASHLPKEIK